MIAMAASELDETNGEDRGTTPPSGAHGASHFPESRGRYDASYNVWKNPSFFRHSICNY